MLTACQGMVALGWTGGAIEATSVPNGRFAVLHAVLGMRAAACALVRMRRCGKCGRQWYDSALVAGVRDCAGFACGSAREEKETPMRPLTAVGYVPHCGV